MEEQDSLSDKIDVISTSLNSPQMTADTNNEEEEINELDNDNLNENVSNIEEHEDNNDEEDTSAYNDLNADNTVSLDTVDDITTTNNNNEEDINIKTEQQTSVTIEEESNANKSIEESELVINNENDNIKEILEELGSDIKYEENNADEMTKNQVLEDEHDKNEVEIIEKQISEQNIDHPISPISINAEDLEISDHNVEDRSSSIEKMDKTEILSTLSAINTTGDAQSDKGDAIEFVNEGTQKKDSNEENTQIREESLLEEDQDLPGNENNNENEVEETNKIDMINQSNDVLEGFKESESDVKGEIIDELSLKTSQIVSKLNDKDVNLSTFFTVPIQLDDGTVKNQIVTIVKSKGKKPFLGGYRHKLSGIEYHNASVQTKPRSRPPPTVELFSRDTQTFQIRHQKVNTNNTVSTQMTGPGIFVSNTTDKLLAPGKYETADEYNDRILKNIIIIQKYFRRWIAKNIVEEKRNQRDERMQWEQNDKELKQKEKEDRIKKEYERRMHPVTQADFDLLYNGLEKWRLDQLAEINASNSSEAEKKAAKLQLLDEETDLLAAIDRHKIDKRQQTKDSEVHNLLSKAAASKSWKDAKGKKIQMDTPYTIRSRELLDILNSLNMQYLTQDERLDVLLTLKHTVKEHDCKLTRDIIDLVDREADLIMRNMKEENLAGLRKRIVTLFLQYCKTPTFNPEISLLLKVPPDPSVLIGDINYCKYCGRYLRSTEFSLSTKSSKLTICKSCGRKENQSRKRQDYSHYRRMLKDLQMSEQILGDDSKIAFIFKQNDVKILMESVWDSKSIISECDDLDELVFVRWDFKEHWSPWNAILMTKEEAEAHRKVKNLSEVYSNVMINRVNQKHTISRNIFESLEKMIDKMNFNSAKLTIKV